MAKETKKEKLAKMLEEDIKFVSGLKVDGKNAKMLEELGIPENKRTYSMMLAIATYENAIEGNSKYFDLVLSVLGSKQKDKIDRKKVEIEEKKLEIEQLKNDVIEDEVL